MEPSELKRPLSVAERRRKWRQRHPDKHRAQQRARYWRKKDAEAVTAQQEALNAALEEMRLRGLLYDAQGMARAGVSALEWLRGIPEGEWEPVKEAVEAAERNLEALTAEELAGIKKIYGFDPVLNPLHIVVQHAKQNLAGHGFYRPGGLGQSNAAATPLLPSASEPLLCNGIRQYSSSESAPQVPPPTPPATPDPAAVERQQLLDNVARLERIRAETEARSAAEGIAGAVVARSRF